MSPEASAAMVCGPLRMLITSTWTPCLRKIPCSAPTHMMASFSLKAPWAMRTRGNSAASRRINGWALDNNAVSKKYEPRFVRSEERRVGRGGRWGEGAGREEIEGERGRQEMGASVRRAE